MSSDQNKSKSKKTANNRPVSKNIATASNSGKNSRKRKKKKSLGFKILMFLLLFILVGGAAIGTYFVRTVNKMNHVELDNSNLGIAEHDDLKEYEQYTKIKNIMLFGTDASETNDIGRSDSMMILTVDPIHNKIKVTSLMRDCYVRIPGFGEDKLNHAYAFGGPELAIRTINENFGLNIEEFATVDFSTLPKVIDILGGVEINVTPEELKDVNAVIEMDNWDFQKDTPWLDAPGLQTLTGEQALSYSRNRSSEGGDFARTERQRTVIEALFKKGLETPITSYPSILNKVLPSITTNMTSSDILDLGKNIVSISNGSLEQSRFPLDEYAEGGFIDEIWYLLYDREATKKHIQDYIFDDYLPTNENTNPNSTDDSSSESIGE
ncbi:MAG: LCP family protein [Clostridium sp.]|nr:LCP family protein [Clostridium sp.]MDU7083469.1 LCP family protein [Clostridium sp.]